MSTDSASRSTNSAGAVRASGACVKPGGGPCRLRRAAVLGLFSLAALLPLGEENNREIADGRELRAGEASESKSAFADRPDILAAASTEAGADVEATDAAGRAPPHPVAAELAEGDGDGAANLLVEDGVDVEAADGSGMTPRRVTDRRRPSREALRRRLWPDAASEEGIRADAEALALRALYRVSEDLLLDEARLAELANELAGVLSRLKSAYPEFAGFRARRDQPVPGELRVRLQPRFARIVRDVLQDFPRVRDLQDFPCEREEGRPIALCTGHRLFDGLNEKLGLRKVDLYGDSAVFHLHERANVAAAARAYSVLEVVQEAKPSKSHLDGADMTAYRAGDGDGWMIFIANRWGDCPSGCIEEERFRFEVEGETVELKTIPKSPTVHGRW